MKYLLISIFFASVLLASLDNINSFEADFTQSITDEKNKVLTYKGHVTASKPQNAKWSYSKPINKDVYLDAYEVTIVEPDIEQVIIRVVESKFDFFNMISNAKEISESTYLANFNNSKFTIIKKNKFIKSISYIDEFENNVKIIFENQKQNHKVKIDFFIPKYPLYFDIIRD